MTNDLQKKLSFPITKLGFGTGRGFCPESSESYSKLLSTISAALDLGINWIDTAPDYFNGNSEKIIGEVLKNNFQHVKVFTKFSPKDSSPSLHKVSEKSLKRLNREKIDILQFLLNTTVAMESICRLY